MKSGMGWWSRRKSNLQKLDWSILKWRKINSCWWIVCWFRAFCFISLVISAGPFSFQFKSFLGSSPFNQFSFHSRYYTVVCTGIPHQGEAVIEHDLVDSKALGKLVMPGSSWLLLLILLLMVSALFHYTAPDVTIPNSPLCLNQRWEKKAKGKQMKLCQNAAVSREPPNCLTHPIPPKINYPG